MFGRYPMDQDQNVEHSLIYIFYLSLLTPASEPAVQLILYADPQELEDEDISPFSQDTAVY